MAGLGYALEDDEVTTLFTRIGPADGGVSIEKLLRDITNQHRGSTDDESTDSLLSDDSSRCCLCVGFFFPPLLPCVVGCCCL